jgi:hypothetical protein
MTAISLTSFPCRIVALYPQNNRSIDINTSQAPRTDIIDLRLIIITYDRPWSLQRLFIFLNDCYFFNVFSMRPQTHSLAAQSDMVRVIHYIDISFIKLKMCCYLICFVIYRVDNYHIWSTVVTTEIIDLLEWSWVFQRHGCDWNMDRQVKIWNDRWQNISSSNTF